MQQQVHPPDPAPGPGGRAGGVISVLQAVLAAVALWLPPSAGFAWQSDTPTSAVPAPSSHEGLDFTLFWDADAYANVAGGKTRGSATDSLLEAGMGLDTDGLGWWRGGTFAVALQAMASTHPSRYVGDLQTLSHLEAPNGRHVAQFWYAQSFGGSALLRAGIMDVNSFFDVNETAGLFANSSFGITPSITANVPTATYPDSAWGVMAGFGNDDDGWRAGVFQGNPADRSSALRQGAMFIAERNWRPAAHASRLNVGAWLRHAPAQAGRPERDWGVYANLEQSLPDRPDTSWFAQLGVSPGGANVVPVYLGGGVVWRDVSSLIGELGVAFAHSRIRHRADETSLEVTAVLPLLDGRVALQPDVQYIFHPAGIYPDALAIGLRLHFRLH